MTSQSIGNVKKILIAIVVVLLLGGLVVKVARDEGGPASLEPEDSVLVYRDKDRGISFRYPSRWNSAYVSPVDWPPQVNFIENDFPCIEAGEPLERAGGTVLKEINGRRYCVTVVREGAAGSVYDQYAYVTTINGRRLSFIFSLRFVGCNNYEDEEREVCEAEQAAFDVDQLVDGIILSVEFD